VTPGVDELEVPCNQLLIRLEDSRWAMCGGGCRKLHPRREFPQYNLSNPPWKRSCGFNIGVVDLCPCIRLTFRERDKLIKALQSPPERFTLKKPLTLLVDALGKASLRHSCSIDTFVNGELVVTTSINLELTLCGHGFFRAKTECVSQYQTERQIEKEAEPISLCPHKEFTFNSSSRYTSIDQCGDCYSHLYKSQSGYNCKQPITVTLGRILGHADWRNDCVWSRNCLYMTYKFFNWHYYWYVCIHEHRCETVCANFSQSSPREWLQITSIITKLRITKKILPWHRLHSLSLLTDFVSTYRKVIHSFTILNSKNILPASRH
jgi:hypothetical protein